MYATFEPPPRRPRSRRYRWAAAAVLGALAITAVIAVAISPDSRANPPEIGCTATATAETVTGSGPGDTTSGPAAILGFQHAYHVTRSADRARTFLTPEAATRMGDGLRKGIDSLPADVRHCVRILLQDNDTDSSRWSVKVTDYRPGADPETVVYAQTVTTRTRDGATLISDITPA